MSREDLPQIIAKNIISLRRSKNMTQATLAEKLGYSDKSVSKWERAEGLPDIICLKKIADLFGVSVDYLLEAEHTNDAEAGGGDSVSLKSEKEKYVVSKPAIVLVTIAGVWLLAAIVYVILLLAGETFGLAFAIAAVASSLLLVIFNSLWGKRSLDFWTIDLLVWSILFLICYICREHNLWILMTIGFPATLVVWLSCRICRKQKSTE
ncbi:MAG: helix-turn-helix transcriptional regulator [Ruminococcaceae bacterium]|nr:helix-turn-helix transcriptional regulator [Oscillospiraceae bacterium]